MRALANIWLLLLFFAGIGKMKTLENLVSLEPRSVDRQTWD